MSELRGPPQYAGLMPGSLGARHLVPELMDDPDLDARTHRQALRGLARINAASRTVSDVWRQLRRCLGKIGLPRARVLDLATGGGDLAIGLARRAQRAGFALEVVASDISPLALEVTSQRARALGVIVHTRRFDALNDVWPDDFDVIVSSLFLHHLTDHDASELLQRAGSRVRHVLIMTDLRRTCAGLVLAHVGVRILSRSRVVHTDGPQSVRAAFTMNELRAVARHAGLEDAEISSAWPQRQRLLWMRR